MNKAEQAPNSIHILLLGIEYKPWPTYGIIILAAEIMAYMQYGM